MKVQSNMSVSRSFRSLLWCLSLAGLLALSTAASPAESEGKDLFEKRCTACHKLPDPSQSPSVGWEQQLELMAPLARLKDNQKQDILGYLLSHSRDAAMDAALDEDRTLFEEKCSRCHTLDRILLSPVQGESLKHIVNRMQSRSGTDWLSDLEVERVLAYLSRAPRTVPLTIFADYATPDQIFAARCSACHTLERVFQELDEDMDAEEFWSHTISRMRGKAPQWMSESEAAKILEYLRSTGVLQQ